MRLVVLTFVVVLPIILVSAATAQGTHTPDMALVGSGAGKVSGKGITCPRTCAQSYPTGTHVTLRAAPASGSVFPGWSGGCTRTGRCKFTISANRTVTATFKHLSAEITNARP